MHTVVSKKTAEAFCLGCFFVSALGGAACHFETLSFNLADKMEPALVQKLLDDLSRGRYRN
jgi:hypothetical protein